MSECFYPFKLAGSQSDCTIDTILEDFELPKLQNRILRYELNELHFTVWFGKDKDSGPRLELAAFGGHGHIASVDLLEVMDLDRFMIGDEEEIVALKKLREAIDAAISERESALSKARHDD